MIGDAKEEEYVIDMNDYRKYRVVFTEKKRKEKAIIHAELNDPKFLKYIEKAVKDPLYVWQDNDDSKRKRCYYWKHSIKDYTKVVIWIYSNPCRVVNAFETNYIKEEKYPKLKRLI